MTGERWSTCSTSAWVSLAHSVLQQGCSGTAMKSDWWHLLYLLRLCVCVGCASHLAAQQQLLNAAESVHFQHTACEGAWAGQQQSSSMLAQGTRDNGSSSSKPTYVQPHMCISCNQHQQANTLCTSSLTLSVLAARMQCDRACHNAKRSHAGMVQRSCSKALVVRGHHWRLFCNMVHALLLLRCSQHLDHWHTTRLAAQPAKPDKDQPVKHVSGHGHVALCLCHRHAACVPAVAACVRMQMLEQCTYPLPLLQPAPFCQAYWHHGQVPHCSC
jgi:hypothetical protein